MSAEEDLDPSGGSGDDTIADSQGLNNFIDGGADNDNLSGNGTLVGGAGQDTLSGTGELYGDSTDPSAPGNTLVSCRDWVSTTFESPSKSYCHTWSRICMRVSTCPWWRSSSSSSWNSFTVNSISDSPRTAQ